MSLSPSNRIKKLQVPQQQAPRAPYAQVFCGIGVYMNPRSCYEDEIPRMALAIFTDFDETITRINVTDAVLERFGDPSWRVIQDEWQEGKLSAREVLQEQMPLITVEPEELNAFLDSIEVDPFFPEFARFCRQKGHALYVLSDGFDYWIERILKRVLPASAYGGEFSFFACNLTLQSSKVEISFPYFPEGCSHGCATCKPALFTRLKAGVPRTIVIGDGASDFLLSRKADWVFAKASLEQFCRSERIPHEPFEHFGDILQKIRRFQENQSESSQPG
jgi:2,3-diketo-5-methylthio-1-phosphopentane phosphatase